MGKGPGMTQQTDVIFDAEQLRALHEVGKAVTASLDLDTTLEAIITRHGGTISMTSTPGQGTIVTVRLPAGMKEALAAQ